MQRGHHRMSTETGLNRRSRQTQTRSVAKCLSHPLFNSTLNTSMKISCPKNLKKSFASVFTPYVKGACEKFRKSIRNLYNVRTAFKTKHTLRSSFMTNKPQGGLPHMAHYVYKIPCIYERNYIRETRQTVRCTTSKTDRI
jgi:hypothetical protein